VVTILLEMFAKVLVATALMALLLSLYSKVAGEPSRAKFYWPRSWSSFLLRAFVSTITSTVKHPGRGLFRLAVFGLTILIVGPLAWFITVVLVHTLGWAISKALLKSFLAFQQYGHVAQAGLYLRQDEAVRDSVREEIAMRALSSSMDDKAFIDELINELHKSIASN